jgi:DNA-binding transcriptional MerR regulator
MFVSPKAGERTINSLVPAPASGLVASQSEIAYFFPHIDIRHTLRGAMKSLGIKKLYYSISEVSKIADLEQYVLRYWESEFEQLRPAKNRAGNRIYTNRDIKLILYIKKLLRDERYTIEGAKQVLKSYTPDDETGEQLVLIDAPKPKTKIADEQLRDNVMEVKLFLEELLQKLN